MLFRSLSLLSPLLGHMGFVELNFPSCSRASSSWGLLDDLDSTHPGQAFGFFRRPVSLTTLVLIFHSWGYSREGTRSPWTVVLSSVRVRGNCLSHLLRDVYFRKLAFALSVSWREKPTQEAIFPSI